MASSDQHSRFLFRELVKHLIVLSLPAHVQKEIYPGSGLGNFLHVELDTYYALQKERYREHGLLDEAQSEQLHALEHYLNMQWNTGPDAFREEAPDHPGWEAVRQEAKNCLEALHKQAYGLKVKFEYTKWYFNGTEEAGRAYSTDVRLASPKEKGRSATQEHIAGDS